MSDDLKYPIHRIKPRKMNETIKWKENILLVETWSTFSQECSTLIHAKDTWTMKTSSRFVPTVWRQIVSRCVARRSEYFLQSRSFFISFHSRNQAFILCVGLLHVLCALLFILLFLNCPMFTPIRLPRTMSLSVTLIQFNKCYY